MKWALSCVLKMSMTSKTVNMTFWSPSPPSCITRQKKWQNRGDIIRGAFWIENIVCVKNIISNEQLNCCVWYKSKIKIRAFQTLWIHKLHFYSYLYIADCSFAYYIKSIANSICDLSVVPYPTDNIVHRICWDNISSFW